MRVESLPLGQKTGMSWGGTSSRARNYAMRLGSGILKQRPSPKYACLFKIRVKNAASLLRYLDQKLLQNSTPRPTHQTKPNPDPRESPPPPQMSLPSTLSLLSALILAFTVLSAGQAKLTSRITPSIYESQVAQDSVSTPHDAWIPISPATRRRIHGVINVVCGVLLLWPSRRRVGAAAAFVLLSWGLVSRWRSRMSVVPPSTMMALSAVVWFL